MGLHKNELYTSRKGSRLPKGACFLSFMVKVSL